MSAVMTLDSSGSATERLARSSYVPLSIMRTASSVPDANANTMNIRNSIVCTYAKTNPVRSMDFFSGERRFSCAFIGSKQGVPVFRVLICRPHRQADRRRVAERLLLLGESAGQPLVEVGERIAAARLDGELAGEHAVDLAELRAASAEIEALDLLARREADLVEPQRVPDLLGHVVDERQQDLPHLVLAARGVEPALALEQLGILHAHAEAFADELGDGDAGDRDADGHLQGAAVVDDEAGARGADIEDADGLFDRLVEGHDRAADRHGLDLEGHGSEAGPFEQVGVVVDEGLRGGAHEHLRRRSLRRVRGNGLRA